MGEQAGRGRLTEVPVTILVKLRTRLLEADDQTLGWRLLGVLAGSLTLVGFVWAMLTLPWRARYVDAVAVVAVAGSIVWLAARRWTPRDEVGAVAWWLVFVCGVLATQMTDVATLDERAVLGAVTAVLLAMLAGGVTTAWEHWQQRQGSAWWLGLKWLGVLAFLLWFVKVLVWWPV